MRIQNNITAMNAQRNLSNNNSALSSNLEKLSSGYRINRAADDAAGLAISEKMRAQITGLETAETNANDGISLVQTAEGALTEVHSMLNRMVELSMKASNGTYSESEREKLQAEVDQLLEEIDRIAESTTFNGISLLSSGTEPDPVIVDLAKTEVDLSSLTGVTADPTTSVALTGFNEGATIEFAVGTTGDTAEAGSTTVAGITVSGDADGLVVTFTGDGMSAEEYSADDINAAIAQHISDNKITNDAGDAPSVNMTGSVTVDKTTTASVDNVTIYTDPTMNAEPSTDGKIGKTDMNMDQFKGITGQMLVTASGMPDGATITVTTLEAEVPTEDSANPGTYDQFTEDAPSFEVSIDTDGNIEITIQGAVNDEGKSISGFDDNGVPILGDYVITDEMLNEAIQEAIASSAFASSDMEVTTSGSISVGKTGAVLPDTVNGTSTVTPNATYNVTVVGGEAVLADGVDITFLETTTNDELSGFNIENLSSDVKEITFATVKADEDALTASEKGYAILGDDGTLTVYLYHDDNEKITGEDIEAILSGTYVGVKDSSGEKVDISFDGAGVLFDAIHDDGSNNTEFDDDAFFQFGSNSYTDDEPKELFTINTSSTATDITTDGTEFESELVSDSGVYVTGSNVYGTGTTLAGTATASSDKKGFVGEQYAIGNVVINNDPNAIAPLSAVTMNFETEAYDPSVGKTIDVELDDTSGEIKITISAAVGDSFTDEEIQDALRAANDQSDIIDTSAMTFETKDGKGLVFEATTDSPASNVNLSNWDATAGIDKAGFATETTVKDITDGETATVVVATAAAPEPTPEAESEVASTALDPIIIQVGNSSDSYNQVIIHRESMTVADLGLSGLDISSSQEAAVAALDQINVAIDKVSDIRSSFGAIQNRLDHTINNLGVAVENMQSAESRVRDVDMAEEMMNYTKNNILVQSAQAMLAQANQVPQGVLQLLQ